MKKIIATVLAMVMALALCSTAFAATSVKAKAYQFTDKKDPVKTEVTADFYAATAANGHFGVEDRPWEKTDLADELKALV